MNKIPLGISLGTGRILDKNRVGWLMLVPQRTKTKHFKQKTADVSTQLAVAIRQSEQKIFHREKYRNWNLWDRGLHAFDGDHVRAGQLLVRQYDLMYHPGQYVDIEWDKTLRAKEPGRMVITSEIIDPDWNNEHVKEQYPGRKGQLIFRKHIHVIPDPLPKKFKLSSLI